MEVQVAPLRAWDDFFPGSDRFARPDFKDISKWNNRVVSNLLYYQTNYLMVAAAVVSIVGSVRGPRSPSGGGGRGTDRGGGGPVPRGGGGPVPRAGGTAARPAAPGKGPARPRALRCRVGCLSLPLPLLKPLTCLVSFKKKIIKAWLRPLLWRWGFSG